MVPVRALSGVEHGRVLQTSHVSKCQSSVGGGAPLVGDQVTRVEPTQMGSVLCEEDSGELLASSAERGHGKKMMSPDQAESSQETPVPSAGAGFWHVVVAAHLG